MSTERTVVTEEVEALVLNPEVIELASEIPADFDTTTVAFSVHADAEAENREIVASPGTVAQAINILRSK